MAHPSTDLACGIETQNTVNISNTHQSTNMQSIKELFIFSPFGLRCVQCEKGLTIQLDERCICRHLKFHGMDSRVVTVSSLFAEYKSQIDKVKVSGSIEQYRCDKQTYIGYSCICGLSYVKVRNANRHCKKAGCDASKLQKVDLIKLCCGSYVSHAQVTSFFETPPRITQQFDYREARAVLLPFLPNREKNDNTYTHMYYPLITQCGGASQFVSKIKNEFTAIHSVPSPSHESMLMKIHEQAGIWVLNFAQMNVLMLPGQLRGGLQTFEGGEVEDVSQRMTYTMQHDSSTLLVELKKFLSFAYRRGSFIGKKIDFKDGFAIAYFLKDLMLEIPSSEQYHPLAVEFCLMSAFRVQKADSKITMISCDTVSSIFAKVSSILKAAICSVVCSFSEDAFTAHGPALITAVRKSHVLNSLSPMLRQIREMHRRIPKRRKTTLDESGNIVVDQFSFRFDDWSQIVPRTVLLKKQ